MWATTSDDETIGADAGNVSAYMWGTDTSGDYAYCNSTKPTTSMTTNALLTQWSSTGFTIHTGPTSSTSRFTLGRDGNGYGVWGGGDAATFVARFVNPSFTTCQTWK